MSAVPNEVRRGRIEIRDVSVRFGKKG